MRSASVVSVTVLILLASCFGAAPPGESTPADGRLAVHFIPVGQSVSTLVIPSSGETMLIDTGHFTDDGRCVLTYLERLGIDHLVVSHNDADHIGGDAVIIETYETTKRRDRRGVRPRGSGQHGDVRRVSGRRGTTRRAVVRGSGG